MLKPEVARERLKEFRTKDWVLRARADALATPASVRTAACALLNHDAEGNRIRGDENRQQAFLEAVRWLAQASAKERLTVFRALFPKIAPSVDAAWCLLARLPYEFGSYRRPFRAPRHPEAVMEQRRLWLQLMVNEVLPYDQEITWFADWTAYVSQAYSNPIGVLLAGAMENGGAEGEAVFRTLAAICRGEHPVSGMSSHVIRALLSASRPEGWELVERLLLAAQRQEGLRQSILEAVDESHPEAYRRMLRLILDQDLLRFSSTVRALDVWFGFEMEAGSDVKAKAVLAQVLRYLEDPGAARDALSGSDAEALYLALWAAGYDDAPTAIEAASARLADESVEVRYAATYFLTQAMLLPARMALLPAVDDLDLRIAITAAETLGQSPLAHGRADLAETDLFERLERLVARCPKSVNEPPLIWPWSGVEADREDIASYLVAALGSRSPERLIPHLPEMPAYAKLKAIEQLRTLKVEPAAVRETLLGMVSDPGEYVREMALKEMEGFRPEPEEAGRIEKLLTRKTAGVRRAALTLLLKQEDAGALASADRLLGSKDALQRQAGLELLRELHEAGRASEQCRERAAGYRSARATRSEMEEKLLAGLDEVQPQEAPTLENGLGLMDPSRRTPPTPPRVIEGVEPASGASGALVKALDEVVYSQREAEVTFDAGEAGKEQALLGDAQWRFPRPDPKLPVEEDLARLPLRETWESWWRERPAELRDADGFELLRVSALIASGKAGYLRYQVPVHSLPWWLLRAQPLPGAVDFILDAAETSLAQIPEDVVTRPPKTDSPYDVGWRGRPARTAWLQTAKTHREYFPGEWSPAQLARLWGLVRWLDEPAPGLPRYRCQVDDMLTFFRAGIANEADVVDFLIGPRPAGSLRYGYGAFTELRNLTGRRELAQLEDCPGLREIVERCRDRVVELELGRGDLATPVSGAALAIRHAGGMETLVRLAVGMGARPFVRGWIYNDQGREAVYSHLIRSTAPAPGETPEAFAERAAGIQLPEKRWVEVAVYAPQWAAHVERVIGWPGFADAVWWVHAHTKDTQWSVDQEIRDLWAAQVSERTPLAAQTLVDGAVDVEWFQRVHAILGEARWKVLDEAAKYASGGNGHTRARLFADAMLGRAERETLVRQLREKRNQDSLRALGLLPLPEGREREAEVLARYQIVQEFVRSGRQFGAQRQASEKLAAAIALENLARTAGYPDPVRLEWAMEAREIADLAAGPLSAAAGDVTVTLSLDHWGSPSIVFSRAGKPLKALPPAAKKDTGIAALLERKKEVERQASRMRRSLEEAMVRGDLFTGAELQGLMEHPVLAPMLRNLVFTGEGAAGEGTTGDGKTGYPVEGGRALERHDGSTAALADADRLRVAHPHDLLTAGEWHLWQRDCFRRERIQPFKQVFRELYVLTETEKARGDRSERYAGHQVGPNQARALLGKRGWVTNPDEGDIRRTFHRENLTAWITCDSGWGTPAEVEGLTLECVGFTRRGEWKPLALESIPPRIFSEVMRDLDLVVSVAHRGGVDPEASQSTVEMRRSLLEETLGLLKITNVRLKDSHALIEGELSQYSVHLGSAVVHRQPGGHLCIVPVHSQHRGRVFLPFSDDDPKTAEVVSKVLMLAKDREIQDPSILSQIRAR